MTETVSMAGSGLVFVNTYSANVSAAYRAAIITAENFYQSHFINAVTLNMSFDYGPISGSFGATNQYFNVPTVSYAALRAALAAHATTADDTAAVNSLPATDPTGGAGIAIAPGMARILGLAGAGTGFDNTILLNSNIPYTFGVDAVSTIEHEISEGSFGRVGGLGFQNNDWGPMDLFRYSSPGQRDLTGGADGRSAYFSIDGTHLLSQFNNSVNAAGVFNGFDVADWYKVVGDSFGSTSPSIVTSTDLRLLDILGWTPNPAAPPTDEYASSFSDTTLPFGVLGANGAATGAIDLLGDRDWFRIQLVAGSTYVISLTGTTLADPDLRLHDRNGVLIVENNDIASPGNLNSQIIYTATTSGTYYLEAAAANDASIGAYQISAVSTTDDYASSITDTAHPFGQLTIGSSANGTLEATGDRDWFRIQLVAGVRYLFNETHGTLADPYLRLHNSSGTTLAENDDASTSTFNSQIAFIAPASGVYYLEAGAIQDNYAGTYTVSTALAPDDYASTLTDTTHRIGQVAVNGSATGTIEAKGDRDWFRVVLQAGTAYTIDLLGNTLGDPYLHLHDATGALLAEDNDLPLGNPNSEIVYTPSATGSYFIEAGANNDASSGIYQVTVSGMASHASAAPVFNDLNGDGKSDLLWQRSDGLIVDWSMNGSAIAHGDIVTSLDSSWKLIGTGDFNGDAKTDLLWQNTSGVIVDWTMSGASVVSGDVVSRLDSSWTLLGTGDLNGDGASDLIWRNTAGLIVDWTMAGSTVQAGAPIGTLDSSWRLLASADFNGDGKSDLLWQAANGTIVEWNQSGAAIIGSGTVGALDSTWKFLAAADFNGDGMADMLWQNTAGLIVEWQMNGTAVTAAAVVGTLDSSWKMLGTGDFNGDGKADILWQNAGGTIVDWTMNGLSVASGAAVASLDSSWKHIGK